MWNLNTQAYLSDDLERRLLQRAIEEQFRFRPVQAVKNLFARLFQTA
ncbi:hypothetical protein L1889_09190 [Paenalcaligenes niemegkensis]|nr:hypothetical protein [Paenalcaligenes niemegkensis]MCQ9616854.1 hypothetical protein [Paenalcaligenes niemegkensis]